MGFDRREKISALQGNVNLQVISVMKLLQYGGGKQAALLLVFYIRPIGLLIINVIY
jgi:hypothetical protein